jgi:hypothetical protein
MKEELKAISRIQVIDHDIMTLKQRLEAIPKEMKALDRAESEAQGEFDNVKNERETLSKSRRAGEQELETAGANLRRLNSQLPQVKTNKEYTAMLHEIESHKASVSSLEEKILADMERLDQLASGEKEAARVLEGQRKKFEQERAQLASEQGKLEGELAEKLRQREEVMASMPREAASVYARVAQGRGGTAVVRIEGTSCGGCFAKLPPQTVNEVRKMEALITCETCGRILVWAQD